MDIASIHNYLETAVFSAVLELLHQHPHLQGRDDTLADIACVALNRLPPRYIRHPVDLAFFQTEHERTETERTVRDAVEFAVSFVQARNAMRARR